jgi:oxygen-independent coproporphyrinogen-3 oxidase
VEDYVDGVLREMEARRGEQAHAIKTVYFGGGTPSLLPIGELARIVEGLRRWFDLTQVEEVTLEANPEDLTPHYLADLAGLGFVNRLSIGVQSLDDGVLRKLNRRHTAQQALEAVENAYAAGFCNISVDFIYGIQGNPEGLDNLDFLEKVNHVSAYSLTVEPGTALAVQVEQGRVPLPDEEEVVRQYHALRRLLEAAGFRQYEVSNYARPGFESKHNSRYWDRTPYLGLGPGAHSFDGTCRKWNNPDGSVGEETLTETDAVNETIMTALRTVKGLDVEGLPERYKKRLHQMMQPYVDRGWLTVEGSRYCPTSEGLLHADGMASALFVA